MREPYPAIYAASQIRFMIGYLVLLPISIIIMGLNIAMMPRMPVYLYSGLTNPEEDVFWLRCLCFAYNCLTFGTFLISESQGEFFFAIFSSSVSNVLTVLTTPTEIDNLFEIVSPAEVLEAIQDSIYRYERLSLLMKKFNRTFSWTVFIYKAFTLSRTCCYVYVLLKLRDKTDSTSLLAIPYGVLALSARIILNLTSFGRVQILSERFKTAWTKVVLGMDPYSVVRICERKLQGCTNFGVFCGNFYMIYPRTILTFYSVTMTYLIIFLQL
jgi:hypothetical protein